jgi:hypothetical protein
MRGGIMRTGIDDLIKGGRKLAQTLLSEDTVFGPFRRTQQQGAILEWRWGPSTDTEPASASILDFQPPEL